MANPVNLNSVNPVDRIKMVKAMEYIARKVNDETVFEYWRINGVADGDIEKGDLSVHDELSAEFQSEYADLEYYVQGDEFATLMRDFLHLMKRAQRSGGLYCDGILSD